MKIKSWWSEDRQWFCVLVDDGICQATVSLTPEEAQTFIAEVCTALHPSREEMLAALKEMVRLSEMGFEASLREPIENGNYAAYERARAVIAKAENAGKKGS